MRSNKRCAAGVKSPLPFLPGVCAPANVPGRGVGADKNRGVSDVKMPRPLPGGLSTLSIFERFTPICSTILWCIFSRAEDSLMVKGVALLLASTP
jgi:hypothetical protein